MSQGVPLWMGCFEEELQKSLRGVIRHPFFFLFLFLKRWPKLKHKRKKSFVFSLILSYLQNSVVPGTGLEPALLSEHAPETCASTNSATRASGRDPSLGPDKKSNFRCFVPRTRLELAPRYQDYPLKVACLPIPPPGLDSFV